MVACGCSKDSFASRAKTRIVVEQASTAADDVGGRSETWSTLLTLWAIVEPMAGREVFISSQLQSRVDSRITIRYQAALLDTIVAAKHRVNLASRLYNVVAVKNLAADMKTEGKVYQQLLCVEGQPS